MVKFAHCHTKRPDGVYVQFERVETFDSDTRADDTCSGLFQDEDYKEEDQARLDAWQNDEWHYVGIIARAHVNVIRNGMGTTYTLESAGLWGVESDSGEEYLSGIFGQEKATLLEDLKAFGSATVVES